MVDLPPGKTPVGLQNESLIWWLIEPQNACLIVKGYNKEYVIDLMEYLCLAYFIWNSYVYYNR